MSDGKPASLDAMQRTRRIAVCFRAEYSGRNVRGCGVVQNISMSGALIEEADHALLTGGEVQIRFPFFDESEPVELCCRVVRETERGFAVRFIWKDRRLQQVLSFAIARAALHAKDAPTAAAPLLQSVRARGS